MADAIRNLVDNAIKYSTDGAHVDVRIHATPPWVHVSVVDDGIGVAPEDAQRIFEPFFRSAHGDATNVRGTGLGLALVKAAAEAHGGVASVVSNGERGSRFTFTLPMCQDSSAAASAGWRRS